MKTHTKKNLHMGAYNHDILPHHLKCKYNNKNNILVELLKYEYLLD